MELVRCRVSTLLPTALSVAACRAQLATCPAWSQLKWPALVERRAAHLSMFHSTGVLDHRQSAMASGSAGDMHTAAMDPRAHAILEFWYASAVQISLCDF